MRNRLQVATLLLWGYYAIFLAIAVAMWVQIGRESLGRFDTIAWDYVGPYTGAYMVVQGEGPLVYDFNAQIRAQALILYPHSFATGLLPFRYPPTLLPILLPFALVPLGFSFHLWLAFSAAVALGCFLLLQAQLRLDRQERVTLLLAFLSFYPLSMHLWQGQTALLVLLGLLLAYVGWKRGSDFWAGAALSLCSVKPTLLVVPLLVLLAKGRWRTLGGFLAGAATLTLPMVPLIGLRGMWGFVDLTITGLSWNDIYGIFPGTMHNWRALTLRLLGPGTASTALLAALTLLSLAALAWAWRGKWQADAPRFSLQIALTVLVTLLTSPHLNSHDLVLWLLAGPLIAFARPAPGPRWMLLTLLLLGTAAPVVSSFLPGPPTVLVAAAMVAFLLLGSTGRQPQAQRR